MTQATHDFLFIKAYHLVEEPLSRNKHPKQSDIKNLLKKTKDVPEHLKQSISDNLIDNALKELASVLNWQNSGGRPKNLKKTFLTKLSEINKNYKFKGFSPREPSQQTFYAGW